MLARHRPKGRDFSLRQESTLRVSISVPQLVFLTSAAIAGGAGMRSPRGGSSGLICVSPTTVFVSERSSPFTTAGFARMIERAAAGASLKAHPRTLRHACGYALAIPWIGERPRTSEGDCPASPRSNV
jgi:hypothetical protein